MRRIQLNIALKQKKLKEKVYNNGYNEVKYIPTEEPYSDKRDNKSINNIESIKNNVLITNENNENKEIKEIVDNNVKLSEIELKNNSIKNIYFRF